MITTDWRDQLARLDEQFDTELIPLKRVEEYLGVNALSVKRDKDFPCVKIGGRYYVPKIKLAKMMSA